MIGGKDQLKLDEDTRACLSPSPWSGGPRLAKPPQRDRPRSPRSGGLGWLARLLLAALEHASVCTRGPTDAQVQLGAWGERPRKQQRRSRFRPPDPTGRLRLQDSRDGPQATLQTGSVWPQDEDDAQSVQHTQGGVPEASRAARTELVATRP